VKRVLGDSVRILLVTALLLFGAVQVVAAADGGGGVSDAAIRAKVERINKSRITLQQRESAAARVKLMQNLSNLIQGQGSLGSVTASALTTQYPGGVPDMFGTTPNWAYSPLLRKFVDGMPGLGPDNANNLGQYLSVAKPDTVSYPGSDYYEISLRQFTEKMHSDLPATTLRGYVQTNMGTDGTGHNTLAPDPIHYLGPFIVARKDRPVRIKFTNELPIGEAGDLFIPVDKSVMGAGMGPNGVDMYTENRGTLHLHGGITPWISDGTPHQWITPAGESTPYPKGVSVKNVPDMPDPGDGSMTFFYSNQQSARLMFYHDHSFGITRLNVYAGEAAGYLITDPVEDKLVANGVIPADQIPIVVQDKTFVDSETVRVTDPTWNWGTGPVAADGTRTPVTGDLWLPHVYVPAQNPALPDGINPTGRWHYGPWFWPPVPDSAIEFPPIPNPYYDPVNAPWEPALMPATPNPSMGMEAFHDTAMVNGTAYPVLDVQPKSYRLRILNASNDRFFNLQMYTADPTIVSADGRRNTEIKMVPAVPTDGYPETWPTDGRVGGAPDPATAGPEWVQIGTEGGFLPAPAVIAQQPITWNFDPTMFNFGNVQDHSLLVAPAERADVIVDFSKYAGKTLILYNDAPTAFPALDARTDYFYGDEDHRDTGGTAPTEAGFGPSTRTIMQIRVAAAQPAPAFNVDTLKKAFATTADHEGVFKTGQHNVIVPDARYNSAYGTTTLPVDPYVRIYDNEKTFTALDGSSVTIPLEPKAIQDETSEVWDPVYGRMSGKLGLEMPRTNATNANFVLYSYSDPVTENVTDAMTALGPPSADGTQLWKITHNGVDTHPIHFHLFDVQLINRVGWDGFIRTPDDNELGWKDTVRISPLEDTIVALRPLAPKLPFGLPDSVRPLNPAIPLHSGMGFSSINPLTGQLYPTPVTNEMTNFGWEYVWHCHILSHEEMDMMRPISLDVARSLPTTPALAAVGIPGSPIALTWTDATAPDDPATWGNPSNEVGFRIDRTTVDAAGAELAPYSAIATTTANVTTFTDPTTVGGTAYAYKVFAFNAAGEVGSLPARVAPSGFFAENVIKPWAYGDGTITPSEPTSVTSGADSPAFVMAAGAGSHLLDTKIDVASIGASASVTFTNVLADHALWSYFVPDSLTITPTVGAGGGIGIGAAAVPGGTISPSAVQNVPYGTNATFTMTPDAHHHVDYVLVDGANVGPVTSYTFTNVTRPHTIEVVFALDTFQIAPTSHGPGILTPDTLQTVAYGGSSTVTITPKPGTKTINVVVDGVSMGPIASYTFTNVQANHTIFASFGMPVYRFYNFRKGVHFYTASEAEKDAVLATLSRTFRLEGVAYYVNTDNPANNAPLYRFFNVKKGVHFYTASEAEKTAVETNLSKTYKLEGIAYYVSLDPSGGATPVHRFYNFRKGVHFYTASEAEKTSVQTNLSSIYTYEGPGFYLAP